MTDTKPVVLDPRKPIDAARAFLAEKNRDYDDNENALLFWDGKFYAWTIDRRGSYWQTLAVDQVRREVLDFLAAAKKNELGHLYDFNPTLRHVGEVVAALRLLAQGKPNPGDGLGIADVHGYIADLY